MKKTMHVIAFGLLLPACDLGPQSGAPPAGEQQTRALEQDMLQPFRNESGWAQTASASGSIDSANPFFKAFGTNGRSCGTCHQADQGWSITPAMIRARFEETEGLDPLFRPHDAASSPNADVSTVDARRDAYSLLLDRGVIRVGLPWKSTSEFDLVEVDDPHGWASATQLSLFRRPLPTTNLRLATSVSWDGRATIATDPTNIRQALKNQSNGATVNHAQAAPLDDATRDAIVDFETSITTAQIRTDWAFDLDAAGATGGPAAMLTQPFAIGMNDPSGPEFTSAAFSLFDSWRNQTGTSWVNWARRRIAAGQELFNNRKFTVRTANGSFETTCTGCHSLPNAGNSSTARFFDIGVSDPNRRDSRMPLYTFRHKVTGEEVRTTDPGRALITGLWTDMNKFKSPPLRGLAARAPYFHDGSAETIEDVVEFYDDRFDMHLTDGEKSRLGEFLRSL